MMTFRGKYGFLSNLTKAEFTWDGRTYTNSEAAFQSAKSLDPAVRDEFSEMTGVAAKRAGKKVALRPDWEDVKLVVMEEVVRAKFSQNPELLAKLLETGDMELCEGNRWHDGFWGVDLTTGQGENHLGRILMKVREELGGEEYLEKAMKMKEEREAAERAAQAEAQSERERLLAELDALPEPELVGRECATRAFGRVTIARREGDMLVFEARGVEKKFALPGCILQGFLIPDDPVVLETYKRRQEIEKRLKEL